MSERVTYKRLLRQFAAIGPYLREDLCEEGRYRFDCLSVCVSAKPAPDKREFWGWWLVLEQEDHQLQLSLSGRLLQCGRGVDQQAAAQEASGRGRAYPQPLLQTHQRQADGCWSVTLVSRQAGHRRAERDGGLIRPMPCESWIPLFAGPSVSHLPFRPQ